MDASLTGQIWLPVALLLLAAVVFLGGVILSVVGSIRADRRHEKLTDRMWNLNSDLMEQMAAVANLDAYAYIQAQKRKIKQRASTFEEPETVEFKDRGTGAA